MRVTLMLDKIQTAALACQQCEFPIQEFYALEKQVSLPGEWHSLLLLKPVVQMRAASESREKGVKFLLELGAFELEDGRETWYRAVFLRP